MAPQSGIFPIFLRAEYREDANGVPKFISRIQQAAKVSEAELARVGNALNKALAAPRTTGGALDLGIPQLREQIKAQEQAAMAAREVAAATKQVAISNTDMAKSLVPSIRAYFDLAEARDKDAASSRAQLAALQLVEAELEKGTRAVQARLQAEQNLANFRKTANINDGAARIISGQGALDRAAVSGATLDSVLGRARTSNPVVAKQRAQEAAEAERAAAAQAAEMERVAAAAAKQAAAMAELARAEAGAANGARLLQAIYQGTALELNKTGTEFQRTAKSARESAAAFQQAFAEQEAEAERAAAAIQKQAAALAALKAQINPTEVAQKKFNEAVAFAKAALDRGELGAREYAQAVKLASAELREAGRAEVAAIAARNGFTAATKAGTTASRNVINSVRAERTAFTQLGQQLQDVGVQYQMGTSALTIFTQQLPQAAFALTGLSDSTDRTKQRIGQFAQILSGPVGGAIVIATALLGPLIVKLFESGEAADASSRSQRTLTEVLNDQTSSIQEVNQALVEYNRLQAKATQASLTDIQARAAAIEANLKEAISIRQKAAARIADLQAASNNLRQTGDRGAFGFDAAAAAQAEALQNNALANDKNLKELIASAGSVRIEVATKIAELQTDSGARIKEGFDLLREEAKKTITDVGALGKRLADLNRAEQRALNAERGSGRGSSGGGSTSARARQAEQLAKFGESAAEQIQRINERFDEQPRLIDAAAQATRQLDAIIADLEQRKPLGFEKLIEDAERAKGVVDDAVRRPLELIRQETEQRLQIEELLAAGQIDRAAALQTIFQLERQIRELTDEQREDIEDIVVREQQRLRVLRDQQAVFNAQLDVLDTVRRSLTDILSGRSTDFFGNFRQALQDLQGQRLFETIFGQTFRDIENELQSNTPLGRANLAFAENVDRAAETTERAENKLYSFGDAVDYATNKLLSDFDAELGAANDNPAKVASDLWDSLTSGSQFTVMGKRPVQIERRSITDLATRISQGIGQNIGAQLEGLLGPRFAALFGEIAGGAIAGKVMGGNVGAVLGGATKLFESGILGNDNRISKIFGDATAGAATGSQVNDISRLLGIRGSRTGSQIGGALGAATGIPGGDIIGAIAGNIIGGLLKKTPRASATIGGVGGSLGLTGVTGTSGALREAASNLGDSVLQTVNRIAEQLGATVNASAGSVSIGQRKDNLRVDTTGRGITKVGNGAIDFGDDVEAAVAFAVRDLIQDGVITGLRQSEQNLLRAGKDVEAALSEVLRFRSVFDQLDEIRDPVGAAVRKLNTEFESLIGLFERASATAEEFADLEELYEFRRAEAIRETTDRIVGSLRSLLNDLKIGDNGLSLRDRRSNALGQFNALAARVAAGDASAFDDFAEISQQLLDIERQLFGSTQAYFDRLNQVTALTEQAIADQTNVTSIGAGAPSPFDDRASIARAIESTGAEQVGWLRAINDNIIALNSGVSAPANTGSGGSLLAARQILSF